MGVADVDSAHSSNDSAIAALVQQMQELQPKKLGRPKKNNPLPLPENSVSGTVPALAPAPKKRGRPRKYPLPAQAAASSSFGGASSNSFSAIGAAAASNSFGGASSSFAVGGAGGAAASSFSGVRESTAADKQRVAALADDGDLFEDLDDLLGDDADAAPHKKSSPKSPQHLHSQDKEEVEEDKDPTPTNAPALLQPSTSAQNAEKNQSVSTG